jgi:dihydropteroate synthase
MGFISRPQASWQLRSRTLTLGAGTLVMGILNVTPDSFSDGGRFRGVEDAVEAGLRMFAEGAAIVDVGGESTRPGDYDKISSQQEVDRVLPVIEGMVRRQPEALLSIDTYRASTARLAVEAGVEIVNDVSGFLWDAAMAETCAALDCGVVVMHTRGRPEEWKALPVLAPTEVVPLVLRELEERLTTAVAAGIKPERIVVDPGFGFGKRGEENYPLLARLDALLALGRPILAGISRKGFLGGSVAKERGNASLAALTAAILNGTSVVRVHDVRESVEAAAVADAVLGYAGPSASLRSG